MILENLAQYLDDNSIGTQGTDLFIGVMPDNTDNVVMIDQTGSVEPDRDANLPSPTIQVMVRNTSFVNGMTKAQAVYDLIHRKTDTLVLEVGGVDVMASFALQEPTHLGLDDNSRHLFTCNYVFNLRGS